MASLFFLRHPAVVSLLVLFDEVEQFGYRLFLRNVLFHAHFIPVEGDLAWTSPHISIVGVGHLTGTIDDAAHDADLEPFQVAGGFLDAGDGGLQVVERAAASRTTDVFGLAGAQTGGLQDAEGGGGQVARTDVSFVHQPQTVGESVDHQRTHVGCGLNLQISFLFLVKIKAMKFLLILIIFFLLQI